MATDPYQAAKTAGPQVARSSGTEHRYHRRRSARAPLMLRTRDEDLAHCEVLDISREGMRLSVVQGPEMGLAVNTVVELSLPLRGEPARSWPTASALVVYSSGTQLGMWFYSDPDDATALVDAILAFEDRSPN